MEVSARRSAPTLTRVPEACVDTRINPNLRRMRDYVYGVPWRISALLSDGESECQCAGGQFCNGDVSRIQ